jgi:hypothetical protein
MFFEEGLYVEAIGRGTALYRLEQSKAETRNPDSKFVDLLLGRM